MSDTYRVETIAADAGTKSCRRPLKVGLYDEAVETTVVTWMGEECSAYVAAFDHVAGAWSDPKRVGTSFEDHHNYPHIIQTHDGRLHVFHGCHNTPLKQSTAPHPHSIQGEWKERLVEAAPEASYPMPFVADDGTAFVFYRETFGVDDRPAKYVMSEDDGETWNGSADLTGDPIAVGHEDRADNMDEIYVGQLRPMSTGDSTDVHLVWTLAGGGEERHEHDRYHRNVYHAVFDPGTLRFSAADGTDLGTWVDRAKSEDHCLVLDTGEPSGHDVDYIQRVHATADGWPLITFGTPAGIHTARWSGGSWDVAKPGERGNPEPPGQVYDLERTGPASFRLYADHPDGIRIFETGDAGRTWDAGAVIDFPSPLRAAVVVDGYRDPARILARESTDWSSFATDRDVYAAGRRHARD